MVQQQQEEGVGKKYVMEKKNENSTNNHENEIDNDIDYVEPKCCYDNDDDNDEIITIDHDENDDDENNNDDENGGNRIDNHNNEDTPKDEDDTNTNKLTNGILLHNKTQQLKNKVDRNWLQKLLRKYWYTTQYQQQTRDGNKNSKILPLPSENYKINAYICAPMVDQSDLPFRLLCRQYGCNIGYTPMIHAKLFQTSNKYKNTFVPYNHIPFLNTTNNTTNTNNNTSDITHMDRPLIGQICGSSIDYVIKTAIELSDYVDGIDINCGCPQNIAKRGNYGAYLLEQEIYLLTLLQQLNQVLTIPVSIKVRLLPPSKQDNKEPTNNTNGDTNNNQNNNITKEQIERNDSIYRSMVLYEKLIHIGGVHMICIHGRTRYQKGIQTGKADWDAIKLIVNTFHQYIPIIGNGSIASQYDIYNCIEYTNVDGIMCSEALLEYPPLYQNLIQYDYYNHFIQKKKNKLLLNNNDNDSNNNNDSSIDGSNTMDDIDDDIMSYLDEMFQTKKRTNTMINGIQLALEYYNIATIYSPNIHGQGSNTIKVIKIHIHRFCHYYLQNNIHIRQLLINAQTLNELYNVIVLLNEQYNTNNTNNMDSNDIDTDDNIDSINNNDDSIDNTNNVHDTYPNDMIHNNSNLIIPPLSWYYRHRYKVQDCFGITRNHNDQHHPSNDNNNNHNNHNSTTTLLHEQMLHESTVKSTMIESLLDDNNDNDKDEEDNCIMDLLFQNDE